MRFVLLAGGWLALLTLLGCGRLRFEDLRDGDELDGGAGLDGEVLPDGADPRDGGGEDTGSFDGELDAEADAERDGELLDGELLDGTSADAASDALVGDAGSCPAGFSGATCTTCVRFVDVNTKAATPDGLSWATAFPEPIGGIVAAAAESEKNPSGPQCQVWVREGRYYIFSNSTANTIPLSPIVPLFGSFAGTERDPSERVISAHSSILDGGEAQGARRVFHPLYSTSGGTVDGFTVTRGLANSAQAPHGDGGGMRVSGGMLFLRNMLFTGNNTTGKGGGLYAQNAVVTIENSRFLNNTADGSGGGISIEPVGTGVEAWLNVRNLELRANVAGGDGGGFYALGAVTLDIENLVAAQNASGGRGGGGYVGGGQGAIVAATLAANTAGATASGLAMHCARSCSLVNAVLWDPSTVPELSLTGPATVRHSIVRGGSMGTAILVSDPLFVAPPGDLHLGPSSPAIDSADGCAGPELDRDGLPRRDHPSIANSGVAPVYSDRGAYEYQGAGSPYPAFSGLCP